MARLFRGVVTDRLDGGLTSILQVPDDSPLATAAWVKWTSFLGVTTTILSRGYNGATTAWSMQGDATLAANSYDGTTVNGVAINPNPATLGVWCYCYFDVASLLWRAYFNGGFVTSAVQAKGVIQNGRSFTIGVVDNNGSSFVQPIDAAIADVAIWDGPLTDPEIANLAAKLIRPTSVGLLTAEDGTTTLTAEDGVTPLRPEMGGMSRNLLGYWPLETAGALEPDTSGNGTNLTVTGTLLVPGPFDVTPGAGVPQRTLVGVGT